MQEECGARSWCCTLITHRPPWPQSWQWRKIYHGGQWKTKKNRVNFTRPRDRKRVSHFPLVNVLGIVSNGHWTLVPNCVQMLSRLGPARGCPVLADSQTLLLGHSPNQAALKDLEKMGSGLGPFPFRGLGVCLLSLLPLYLHQCQFLITPLSCLGPCRDCPWGGSQVA